MQTKEKCWMEGTQTKVTREKKKSFSKPLYIFTPSLSFSTCLYLCPLMATLLVFQLLLFPNKDGCLPLRHRGNTFRATCLCYSFKTMRLLFSFISILSVVFFPLLPFDLILPLSRTNFIQKSLTQKHTFLRTHTQHTQDYYLPFCYKLLCVRGQDVLMLPVYLWAK